MAYNADDGRECMMVYMYYAKRYAVVDEILKYLLHLLYYVKVTSRT